MLFEYNSFQIFLTGFENNCAVFQVISGDDFVHVGNFFIVERSTAALDETSCIAIGFAETCISEEFDDPDAFCGHFQFHCGKVCGKTGGKTAVITTLGGDGSMITWDGGQFTAKSRKVKPVRIKGAGDTFLGTFVYAKFVCGMGYEEAVQTASDAATKYVEG